MVIMRRSYLDVASSTVLLCLAVWFGLIELAEMYLAGCAFLLFVVLKRINRFCYGVGNQRDLCREGVMHFGFYELRHFRIELTLGHFA